MPYLTLTLASTGIEFLERRRTHGQFFKICPLQPQSWNLEIIISVLHVAWLMDWGWSGNHLLLVCDKNMDMESILETFIVI